MSLLVWISDSDIVALPGTMPYSALELCGTICVFLYVLDFPVLQLNPVDSETWGTGMSQVEGGGA